MRKAYSKPMAEIIVFDYTEQVTASGGEENRRGGASGSWGNDSWIPGGASGSWDSGSKGGASGSWSSGASGGW